MTSKTLTELRSAIELGDVDTATALTKKAIEEKIDPVIIVQQLTDAARDIGNRFSRLEVFLSQLMATGQAMRECISILKPIIAATGAQAFGKGKIVIGTVSGDIHDIGKAVVGAMLTASGFDVVDIGIDVPAIAFIEKAREVDAKIIALSALMSTTAPYQKDVIQLLKELNVRNRYKVMIGGGAVTKEWAEEIGADGFGADAIEAVRVAEKLAEK